MSLEIILPNLAREAYVVTSAKDTSYNCIAWAAGDSSRWWWPDPFGQKHWPDKIPREETLSVFIQAFHTIGYEPCADGSLQIGMEKVAIYAKQHPTHAARQLQIGTWTSKLGQSFDIEHASPQGVEGEVYGNVAQYLVRPLNSEG